MTRHAAKPLLFWLSFSACLSAAQVKGTVVDPSGAPVGGAQVSVVSRLGVESQTVAAPNGAFALEVGDMRGRNLVVTAPGFSTRKLPLEPQLTVKLEIAPQVDAVRVVGSALDVAASRQGGSVSLIPSQQIRERNEPYAVDLLRYVPGMEFNQSGAAGSISSLFCAAAIPISAWWKSTACR